MILRGVSEGISKDMKITDAESYKCKRKTKAQAVKGRNQYVNRVCLTYAIVGCAYGEFRCGKDNTKCRCKNSIPSA